MQSWRSKKEVCDGSETSPTYGGLDVFLQMDVEMKIQITSEMELACCIIFSILNKYSVKGKCQIH